MTISSDNMSSAESSTSTENADEHKTKHYRVIKTVLPSHVGGGPCGFGDPNDRTLRKAEINYAIPRKIKTETQATKCAELYDEMMACANDNKGYLSFLGHCQDKRDLYNACMTKWCNDPEYVKEKTEEYLARRSEYRNNCETVKEQKLYEYRWRKYLREEEAKNQQQTPSVD